MKDHLTWETTQYSGPFIQSVTIFRLGHWVPFQYPIRRLIRRSRKVSKPRDLYLELFDRSESSVMLPMCLSYFKAMRFRLAISRFRDFTRSYDKTSYRILKGVPGFTLTSSARPRCKPSVQLGCSRNVDINELQKYTPLWFLKQEENPMTSKCACD